MKPEMPPPDAPSSADSSPGLSIYQLAFMHCRERLLVPPLYWTNRQLELLQCSFGDPSPAPTTTSSDFTGELNGARHVRLLFTRSNGSLRENGIRGILARPECPLVHQYVLYSKCSEKQFLTLLAVREDIKFYFLGKALKALHCTLLLLRADPSTPCIAVYIDREHLERMRFNASRRKRSIPKGREIAHALFRQRLRKITPKDPLHDPYIAALLIAVAQDHHRDVSGRFEKCPTTYPVILFRLHFGRLLTYLTKQSKVLLTCAKSECIYLYSAEVSSTLLDMLDNPAMPPASQPSVSIQITTIHYRPRGSLRDRLFALLLPVRNHPPTGEREAVTSTTHEAKDDIRIPLPEEGRCLG